MNEPTGTTGVVNIRSLPPNPADWPADAVYIGRRIRRHGYTVPRSIWANPYVMPRDGTREEVVAKYEPKVRADPVLMARLGELDGKTLVCFCAPKLCHGHVLARLVAELRGVATTHG